MAKDAIAAGAVPSALQAHERLVADAMLMLDYAVGSGVKTADGHIIPDDIINKIESTADKLGLLEPKGGAAAGQISASDWAAFDVAYYDLAAALSPVTAETLRNTAGKVPGSRTFTEILRGDSAALRFTRCLWYVSLAFAAFVLGSNWYLEVMPVLHSDANSYVIPRTILELMTPWAYGGLGACVYLLRSAHTYIYLRTFDVRRKPEYFNRILLGAFAGGAIIMFANNIAGDDGTVIQLGSAALGFLAGYNTDLLFNALERISSALLPKLGIDTMQRAPAATTKPVDVNALANLGAKAKGPEKDRLHKMAEHALGIRPKKGT